MNKQTVIENAIRNKLQLFARYDGYYRELCPHLLGYKGNTLNLLSYQFGGGSESGNVVDWKCMHVSEIEILSTSEGVWHTAENHSRKANCIDVKVCEVLY